MAVLLSATSGLASDPNTWRVVEPISYANVETNASSLGTTNLVSPTFSVFTNSTLEGIAIKMNQRATTPLGTFSVRLQAAGVTYSGTEVILNVSDVPATPASYGSPYWLYFRFSTVISVTSGVTYAVVGRSSNVSQISWFYTGASTTNWNRCLVTTATAVPSNRDTMIVVGPHFGPGSSASNVITFDNTTNTVYGSNSASFSALEIGKNGTFNFQTNPDTNYRLIANGPINIGGGGVMTVGTVGTPIPSSSTALISFSMSTANQFQINLRTFGYFYTYGATKSGRALLGSNASAGTSSITTTTPTNWNQNDRIVIAPTTNSFNGIDIRTMSTTASGVTISLTATISNAKTIWTNTECEIINTTRNIRIVSPTSATDSIHTYNGVCIIDSDYTEYNNCVWSNAIVETSTTTINFVGCSFWYAGTTRNLLTDTNIPSGTTITFDDCVMGGVQRFFSGVVNNIGTSSFIIRDVWGIRPNSDWINLTGGESFTMERCRWIASPNASGALILGNNSSHNNILIIRNCVFKCGQIGLGMPGAGAYTVVGNQHDISGNRFYLNSIYGIGFVAGVGSSFGWVVKNSEMFSNATANIHLVFCGDIKFIGATLYGGPTQSSPIGVRIQTSLSPYYFENISMTTHSTADVSLVNSSNHGQAYFRNSIFGSTTEVASPTTILAGPSFVTSARHDQTDGNNIIWRYNGRLSSDPVIFRTSPRSLRITPLNASFRIESTPVLVPVEDGRSITVGVWVRRSVAGDGAAHNGNFPRLVCKVNTSVWDGSTDIILATASAASNGAWQYISGTTPVSIDDAAFEIVVDTDGTAGWVNVDDMFISKQNSTKGFKYWSNASPVPTSTTNNGSAVIFL
jgi:hypothetical protein